MKKGNISNGHFNQFKLKGNWILKSKLSKGKHNFKGNLLLSNEVCSQIDRKTLLQLVKTVKSLAKIYKGLGDSVVIENTQTNKKLILNDTIYQNNRFVTIMFDWEY